MSNFKHGLVAALESLENQPVGGIPINDQEALMTTQPENPDPSNTDVQPIDTSVSLEEHEAELKLQDQEHKCDQLDTEIDEAVASASRLEDLQEFSRRVQDEQGGMRRETAGAISIAVEAAMANLGATKEETNFPALENFGEAKTRAEGTEMAIESIAVNLTTVWETVIKALKTAAQQMLEYAKEFTSQAGRVKQRSERLRRYAEGVTGVAQVKTFKNASLASRLAVNGIVNPNILAEANRVIKVGDELFAFTSRHSGTEFSKFYIGAKNSKATVDDVVKAFATPTQGALKKTNGDHNGLSVFETDRLPGDFVALLAVPTGGHEKVNYNEVLSETHGKMERVPASRTVREEIPLLSIADCISLLSIVEDMMDRVIKFEPQVKEFKKNRETLAQVASELMKESEDDEGLFQKGFEPTLKDGQDEKDRLIGLRYGMLAANRIIGQPSVAYARYMTSYGRALTQYVESALGTYGKESNE